MYHPDSIFYLWTTERLMQWIDVVGPERTVLGSDLGQTNNPLPIEGIRALAQDLLDRGVREADLELMIKRNPAWLLGLDD